LPFPEANVKWGTAEFDLTVIVHLADDDDIDSAGERRRVDRWEVPVVLVRCTDRGDGTPKVVHAAGRSKG
jgi:hypothetical protein